MTTSSLRVVGLGQEVVPTSYRFSPVLESMVNQSQLRGSSNDDDYEHATYVDFWKGKIRDSAQQERIKFE